MTTDYGPFSGVTRRTAVLRYLSPSFKQQQQVCVTHHRVAAASRTTSAHRSVSASLATTAPFRVRRVSPSEPMISWWPCRSTVHKQLASARTDPNLSDQVDLSRSDGAAPKRVRLLRWSARRYLSCYANASVWSRYVVLVALSTLQPDAQPEANARGDSGCFNCFACP